MDYQPFGITAANDRIENEQDTLFPSNLMENIDSNTQPLSPNVAFSPSHCDITYESSIKGQRIIQLISKPYKLYISNDRIQVSSLFLNDVKDTIVLCFD